MEVWGIMYIRRPSAALSWVTASAFATRNLNCSRCWISTVCSETKSACGCTSLCPTSLLFVSHRILEDLIFISDQIEPLTPTNSPPDLRSTAPVPCCTWYMSGPRPRATIEWLKSEFYGFQYPPTNRKSVAPPPATPMMLTAMANSTNKQFWLFIPPLSRKYLTFHYSSERDHEEKWTMPKVLQIYVRKSPTLKKWW